jgi:hypothetical protein
MRECRFAFLGNANARPMWDGEMRTRGVCVVWANSHTLTLAGAHRRIRTGKPKWPPYTSRRPRVSLLRHVRRFLAVAVKERFDAAETFFYRVGRVFLRAMNASVSARQNRTRARAPGVAAGTTRFGWPRCRTCECFTAHQVSFNATNSRRCASFKASRLGVLVTGAFCTSQTRARHNIQSPDPLPLSFTAPSTRNGVPRCGICWCWWRTSSRLLTRAGNSMRN